MSDNRTKSHKFRLIGLRGKLLLATLLMVILPIAGFSYLKGLEVFLKKNHSESMLVIAKTIASAFQGNASLLTLNHLTQNNTAAIYCYPQNKPITIDGLSSDWSSLPKRKGQNLSLLCSSDEQYYYFLVHIKKSQQQNTSAFGTVHFSADKASEIIQFHYLDYAHKIQHYHFYSHAYDRLNGNILNDLTQQTALLGKWHENPQGYFFELRVPITQVNHYVSFTQQTPNASVTLTSKQLKPIILTDPLSTLRLEQLVPDKSRLWLLNKQHYVSARTSHNPNWNKQTKEQFSLLSLYRKLYLFIMAYPEKGSFFSADQSRINSTGIEQTLLGHSSVQWLDSPHSDRMILSVNVPVYDFDNEVIGSLVLEQSNDTLLALQDNTFEQILWLSIGLFLAITATLLFFSTQLLTRITQLRDDTNKALSSDGQITNQLYRHDNDEIGDLARSFSSLLTQVEQNNQYLRSLAGKLSHELRTPLTIIKSSIENIDSLESHTLENNALDDKQTYLQRAYKGCLRLNDLLNRMSEANRLEQAIASTQKEVIDMVSFFTHYIDSIQASHADSKIIFHTSMDKAMLAVSPELMAQLFDKLISNAISFHKKSTAISLTMSHKQNSLILELKNYGELIDQDKLSTIFSSLTSYRKQKSNNTHLGIGLHIAQLISQYHGATLEARNNSKDQSVSFILTLAYSEQE